MTSFNSQTWLTLGDEIIKYCVKFFSIYCQCCEPDDFFMFVLYIWIAFMYIVFQTSTQMIYMGLDWLNRHCTPDLLFGPKHVV